jgi:hypothetical protein
VLGVARVAMGVDDRKKGAQHSGLTHLEQGGKVTNPLPRPSDASAISSIPRMELPLEMLLRVVRARAVERCVRGWCGEARRR